MSITTARPFPRVSLVIPTYNHTRYLGDAIESGLNQTVAPFECIVVDDGSSDHPERVTSRYPEVRLIRQENQGLAAARNTGLRASTGEYLVFLDADDRLLPRALELNLSQFAVHGDCGFVYAGHSLIDADGEPLTGIPFRPLGEDAYASLLEVNCVAMCATAMFRRDCIEAAGGFDTNFRACEDYDLYLRMAQHFPVACDPECIAEYRKHDANMTGNAPLILRHALEALRLQKPYAFRRPEWKASWRRGVRDWKRHYANEQVRKAFHARDASLPWMGMILEIFLIAPRTTRQTLRTVRREGRRQA